MDQKRQNEAFDIHRGPILECITEYDQNFPSKNLVSGTKFDAMLKKVEKNVKESPFATVRNTSGQEDPAEFKSVFRNVEQWS